MTSVFLLIRWFYLFIWFLESSYRPHHRPPPVWHTLKDIIHCNVARTAYTPSVTSFFPFHFLIVFTLPTFSFFCYDSSWMSISFLPFSHFLMLNKSSNTTSEHVRRLRNLKIVYSNKCKTKSESFVKATTEQNPPSWHGAWHCRRRVSPVDLALQRLQHTFLCCWCCYYYCYCCFISFLTCRLIHISSLAMKIQQLYQNVSPPYHHPLKKKIYFSF